MEGEGLDAVDVLFTIPTKTVHSYFDAMYVSLQKTISKAVHTDLCKVQRTAPATSLNSNHNKRPIKATDQNLQTLSKIIPQHFEELSVDEITPRVSYNEEIAALKGWESFRNRSRETEQASPPLSFQAGMKNWKSTQSIRSTRDFNRLSSAPPQVKILGPKSVKDEYKWLNEGSHNSMVGNEPVDARSNFSSFRSKASTQTRSTKDFSRLSSAPASVKILGPKSVKEEQNWLDVGNYRSLLDNDPVEAKSGFSSFRSKPPPPAAAAERPPAPAAPYDGKAAFSRTPSDASSQRSARSQPQSRQPADPRRKFSQSCNDLRWTLAIARYHVLSSRKNQHAELADRARADPGVRHARAERARAAMTESAGRSPRDAVLVAGAGRFPRLPHAPDE